MDTETEIKAMLEMEMLTAARGLVVQKQMESAIAFYRKICEAFPNSAAAHRELAVLLFQKIPSVWLPWARKSLASEALLAASRANSIDSRWGDNFYIMAEAGIINGQDKGADTILKSFQYAYVRYENQIECGEQVGRFYLDTALRLADAHEAKGERAAAVLLCEIVVNSTRLEAQEKLKPGSSNAQQIAVAKERITRLQKQGGQA